MRFPTCSPVLAILVLAAPAGAMAASGSGIAYHAGLAAVIVWLAGLGWGFHSLLHHRLAAEDRLARMESDIASERDTRATQLLCTRRRILLLETEWQRLEASLCDGDLFHVSEGMRAVRAAITVLQQSA